MPGQVGHQESHQEAVHKPQAEKLGHGGRTRGHDGEVQRQPRFIFRLAREFSVLWGCRMEDVEAALEILGAEINRGLVLVGEAL